MSLFDPKQANPTAIEAYQYELYSPNSKTTLYFLGTNHNTNTINQREKINKAFGEYKPNVVIIEGFSSLTMAKKTYLEFRKDMNKDTMYNTQGEIAYSTTIAQDLKIKLIPGEPKDSYILKKVYERFKELTKERIFCKEISKTAYIYLRKRNNFLDLKDKISYAIANFKKNTKWEDFDYSPANFFKIVSGEIDNLTAQDISDVPPHLNYIYSHLLKYQYSKFNYAIADNLVDKALFSYLFTYDTEYYDYRIHQIRNIALLSKIRRQIRYGKLQFSKTNNIYKILIIFGQGHAKSLEPAIREIMN